MNAVYCSNKNLYQYLPTVINSLLINNPEIEKVYVLAEDDKINGLVSEKINVINITDILNEKISEDNFNSNTIYGRFSLARLVITDVINDDSILYLDVDTLVMDNISELFSIDLGNNYYAAVPETNFPIIESAYRRKSIGNTYVNSGIMLLNLKKMRENNFFDKCFELLNKYFFPYPDQDVMQIVGKNKILYLSDTYNSFCATFRQPIPKILHGAGNSIKFWDKRHPLYADYEKFIVDKI